MLNQQVIQGDCNAVLQTLPNESVDFVLTDPPYLVRYRDRSGRSIANDDNSGSVLSAFGDVYRVLKPNTFCVSFYGWSSVAVFFQAWKRAGFAAVGHIVGTRVIHSVEAFSMLVTNKRTCW